MVVALETHLLYLGLRRKSALCVIFWATATILGSLALKAASLPKYVRAASISGMCIVSASFLPHLTIVSPYTRTISVLIPGIFSDLRLKLFTIDFAGNIVI